MAKRKAHAATFSAKGGMPHVSQQKILGFTLALICGGAMLLSALPKSQSDSGQFVSLVNAGLSVVFCALAYRSAKRRFFL